MCTATLRDSRLANELLDRTGKASFIARGGRECNVPHFFPARLDQITDDGLAALDHLRARPHIDARRIGVMGFSYGGSAALRLASPRYHGGSRRFGAVVSFYPLCAPYSGGSDERSDNPYSDVDTPAVVTNCVARVESIRRAGRPVGIKLFPGAGHAFDVYHAGATRDATVVMLQFFDQHLGREALPR